MSEHDVASDSLHGRLVLGIVASANSLGLDMRAIAEAAGIDLPALATDPDASVPAMRAIELWRQLETRSGNPLIGLAVAHRIPLGVLGFVYHSLNVSDRLRDAMVRGARYQRLIAGPLRSIIVERADEAQVTISAQQFHATLPFATEQHLICLSVRALAGAVGGTLVPRRVSFTKPWAGEVRPFVEAFAGAAVLFDQPEAGFVLDLADLERPVPSSDPTLATWLDAQAEQRLEAQSSRDVLQRIRSGIQVAFGRGEPSLDGVAHLLHLSTRTLQRRLHEEQTSFAAEVDAVRKELAMRLLAERGRATADVAFLVGYSEISPFYRAFRRWTGVAPAEWRKGAGPRTS